MNDFPVSSTGNIDMIDLYDSFLKCEELTKKIKKSDFGSDNDFAFYKLLKEVHSTKFNKPALFRKRNDADNAIALLWLSRAKEAASIFVAFNKPSVFRGIASNELSDFAKLSIDVNNIKQLDQILLKKGIVIIYEPSITGMKIDGAAFTLSSDNPVIALSLRYPRLDNFWFTLMHELAHISLHYDQLRMPILDDLDIETDDVIELEANRLASSSLISRSAWRSCQAMYSQNDNGVLSFANNVGVHPSIVAGRIQKELNRYDLFSKIVNEVNVREILFNHG